MCPSKSLPITPADVAEVEKLIASGKLNDKLAKQTVEGVLKGEGTPDEVVKKHDYKIVEDNGAIERPSTRRSKPTRTLSRSSRAAT